MTDRLEGLLDLEREEIDLVSATGKGIVEVLLEVHPEVDSVVVRREVPRESIALSSVEDLADVEEDSGVVVEASVEVPPLPSRISFLGSFHSAASGLRLIRLLVEDNPSNCKLHFQTNF